MRDKYYWVSMDGTCEIGDMTKEQLIEVVLTLLAMLKRANELQAVRLGREVTDDNEADALLLLAYAMEKQ